ncbi:ferrous iron transport protein B [Helicobacter pylori]|uniref:Fe(2+) transporter FeoB n=1 Tax=Helicobacter pylori (strain J99 / ATCC 700824) TaxID=85963 RepID=FEOB_HELPJ|nr:ferrous iron transport protein B [Helicobacter pylori]Q9ZLF3.1 RecName: Full=Fe(2+) transporter FeoB; AltName: Full=Ferrous iron transport protein B [Helicobacter pylori J99]AAD06199.1 FERROUS IRON TRANSPORT PROTEIN B [Helicobacter pylori J99]AKE81388.1 iron transporter [Helicobacter pylori J99]AVL49232.1 ferrous iron transporter B [Helicobacter pylori]MWR19683.1 ferrous iron transport protein B [Helicobacter pylori]MWR35504.1 ferrous iron transport protein B [Helicobacter pylori]
MKEIIVALVGQPNVGKSSLINALSNAHLKVGNFAGVTVDKMEVSLIHKDHQITIIDLPGTYALNDFTTEEKVTKDFLEKGQYDLILNVVDSTNLERNLALSAQLLDTNKKMLLALNMWDEAKKEGININTEKLSQELGVVCVPTSARSKEDRLNTELLLDEIVRLYSQNTTNNENIKVPSQSFKESLKYSQSAQRIAKSVISENKQNASFEHTYKIDKILMHQRYGIFIFLGFMFIIFSLSFLIGGGVQKALEEGFKILSDSIKENVANEDLASLVGDGIIGGVGATVSFLPLIVVLYFGISLLETTGYMSRVAFLLDGILHKFGLHGKSFIPLITGFGCSVPAYMATRTLQNYNERLITLFVIGFMSCSARLPIYVLFVGSFFPSSSAGFVLFCIYILGAVVALVMAKLLKLSVFKGQTESFIMEMPKYRFPSWRMVYFSIYTKSLSYLKKAGTYILVGAILIWFMSQYPKNDAAMKTYKQESLLVQKNANLSSEAKEEKLKELKTELDKKNLKNSVVGRGGAYLEKVFNPMDFDWRLSVSLVTGFMAKEVVVSTLGVLFSLGDQNEKSDAFREIIRKEVSVPSGIAFIVFVMFYIPCFAATITFGREAGGIKFVAYLFIFTTVVAYAFSLIAFYATQILV